MDLKAIYQESLYDLIVSRQVIVSSFACGTVKPRAHFSYCAMPHQADDIPGNASEISGEAGGNCTAGG